MLQPGVKHLFSLKAYITLHVPESLSEGEREYYHAASAMSPSCVSQGMSLGETVTKKVSKVGDPAMRSQGPNGVLLVLFWETSKYLFPFRQTFQK